MPKHSQEPWNHYRKGGFIETADHSVILDGSRFYKDRRGDRRTEPCCPHDLDRTVACVNALVGVPDPEKLMTAVREVVEVIEGEWTAYTEEALGDAIGKIAAALEGDS